MSDFILLTSISGVKHVVNPKYVTHMEEAGGAEGSQMPPQTKVWVVSHAGYGTVAIAVAGHCLDALLAKFNEPAPYRANAHLIAAAPELLEVARLAKRHMLNIEENCPLDEHERDLFDKARAAIDKATPTPKHTHE